MKRNTYTKEFKVGAAKMVVIQKMKVSKAASDLGVSISTIARWVRDYQKDEKGAFPGKGFLAPQDEEVRRLEKENRRLTMERDLLKKTIVLFAELDKKNITL
jgi:transposase